MSKPTVEQIAKGVVARDRTALGRAITLVESTNSADQQRAQRLLSALHAVDQQSHHIGITGVPGVGKSTFIEALGSNLTSAGHRVAVLAVDPSSGRTGGSILGDKTRMPKLAVDSNAFIRPSPAAGTLGGVTRRTRESMIVCRAAGFDVILVETVGAGQSETAVADMVDFFLVLMLPGAGDDLQGIKKGVLEIADMIAVNKADGDNVERAQRAAADYRSALRILTPNSSLWQPPVLQCSGLTGEGLEVLWSKIHEHRQVMMENGEFEARRNEQLGGWFEDLLHERILAQFWDQVSPGSDLHSRVAEMRQLVRDGEILPAQGVQQLLESRAT